MLTGDVELRPRHLVVADLYRVGEHRRPRSPACFVVGRMGEGVLRRNIGNGKST